MSDLCLLVAEALSQRQLTENAVLKLSAFEQASLLSRSPQRVADPALDLQQTSPHATELVSPEFSESNCATTSASAALEMTVRSQEDATVNTFSTDASTSLIAATRDPFLSDLKAAVQAPVVGPRSGSQLYRQRLEALRTGTLYTRMPSDSFHHVWAQATTQPNYTQWKQLLSLEAKAVARGQGDNRLSIFVGDSLSLWFPSQRLPGSQLWLNQGISGDTTTGILQRLSAIKPTRPDTIYVMAGINDLRRGASDETVARNLRQVMRQLRQNHPQAQVVVQSILPTRYAAIPSTRIRALNQQIKAIARQEGAYYLDLFTYFTDSQERLHRDLTTDGLHLNPRGYQVWQLALQQAESQLQIARNRQLTASRGPTPRNNLKPGSLAGTRS